MLNLVEAPTRIAQTIFRSDGSEAKIVAEKMFGAGLTPSINVFVLKRPSPNDEWILCSDKPHPDWLIMPVDEYVTRGRSEMLQTVTTGEILKVVSMLH